MKIQFQQKCGISQIHYISDNMVYAGFRDARRDIQDPPEAQSARASPDPHDEEYLDARPDEEEMEDAINKFLVQLEKQEKKGFRLQGHGQRVVTVAQSCTRVR